MKQVYEYLEQVGKLDRLINAKIAERDRLYEIATDISPKINGMPFSNTGDTPQKLEDAVIKIITLAAELDKLIDSYVDTKREVVKTLEKLPAKEYSVLHEHYIQYKSLNQIALEWGYSSRQIRRIKHDAIKKLKIVL